MMRNFCSQRDNDDVFLLMMTMIQEKRTTAAKIDPGKRARIKVRTDITSEQATSDQSQRVVWRRRHDHALFL